MGSKDVHSNNPERDLWQTVLRVLVEDALFGGMRHMAENARAGEEKGSRRAHDCQKARDYLTTPSCDLSIVCNLAGLDMQAVIDHMTRQIAAAPSPDELAASTIRRGNLRIKPEPKPKPEPKAKRKPKHNGEANRYTFNGETLTAREWATRTHLPHTTILSRIAAGWPIERVVTEPSGGKPIPPKPRSRPAGAGTPARKLTHAGETMTLKQWAARLGLSKPTIEKRLRAGWPIEQVLSPQNMRGKSFAAW